jgi:predicted nucleic acid-binding protein
MPDYWDTSCLIKLYCRESDSEAFMLRVREARSPLTTFVLAKSELYFAFRQKQFRGEITGPCDAQELFIRFLRDIESGHIQLIPMGDDVEAEARRIGAICYRRKAPVALRTLDALHLAAACLSQCGRLISTDARMNAAAGLLDLRTIEG